MASDTVQHALALAEQGLKIVLLGDAGTERAKIPRLKTWGTKATSDEDQIIELFESFPKANIGALLGPEGGIIDVEFDTPEGREKADELFKGVVTVAYESVRSVHRLFKWSDEMPAQQKIEVDGLEIRFGGGGKQTQSVLPPSIHPTGTPYKWLPGLSPMETDIAEMPYELLVRIVNGDDLKTTSVDDFEPKSEEEWSKILDGVQEGGRNNAMATYVGGELRDMPDLDDQAALARKYKACEAINERNKPPLPAREVRQTFLSILRKERNRRTSEGISIALPPNDEDAVNRSAGLPEPKKNDMRLVIIEGEPAIFRLYWGRFTRSQSGYVDLCSSELGNFGAVQKAALERAYVWIPNDYRKEWAKKGGTVEKLMVAAERVRPDTDLHRPAIIAEAVLEKIRNAPETDESELKANGIQSSSGVEKVGDRVMVRPSHLGRSLRAAEIVDKLQQHELLRLLRDKCGAKEERSQAGRWYALDRSGQTVLRSIYLSGRGQGDG